MHKPGSSLTSYAAIDIQSSLVMTNQSGDIKRVWYTEVFVVILNDSLYTFTCRREHAVGFTESSNEAWEEAMHCPYFIVDANKRIMQYNN